LWCKGCLRRGCDGEDRAGSSALVLSVMARLAGALGRLNQLVSVGGQSLLHPSLLSLGQCSVLEWMLSASAAYRAQTQVLICGGAAVVEGEYQIVADLISSGFLPPCGLVVSRFCLARFSRDGTDGAHLGHTANWGGTICVSGAEPITL